MKSWQTFQKIAFVAFVCVELLIFVGAFVRASGSGLGCPDWPFCYGCWVPPSSAEAINFDKLDLEKFRAKAARHGRDPATITEETLRAEYDPVSTWVEYINRLTSLPVGLSVVALFFAGFGQLKRGRPAVTAAAMFSLALVLANAWLGARVVLSGLKPGTITLHMALAILLLCTLVFAAWRGTDQPWRLPLQGAGGARMRWVGLALFLLVAVEGVMGSQVREMTDELAKLHSGQARASWVGELEQTWVYLVHRSFSWAILGVGIWFMRLGRRALPQGPRWLEKNILGLILGQMCLGLILAQVGILAAAQILHIGLSSLLVSGLFLWLLGAALSLHIPAKDKA